MEIVCLAILGIITGSISALFGIGGRYDYRPLYAVFALSFARS